MPPIQKSGAIILRHTQTSDEILLLYRAKQNDWTFPKGHINPNETPSEAMRREVKEETGLIVDEASPLPDHEYQNNHGEMCELKMFLVTVKDEKTIPEFSGDKLRWVKLDKAMSLLTHENLKKYLHEIEHIL